MDLKWFEDCRKSDSVLNGDFTTIDGIKVELPIAAAGGTRRDRDWQRRVAPDLLPDSANADAAERTPFKILFSLTTNQGTDRKMRDVLDGELEPLGPLFQAETRSGQKKKMTLAFHVLAVRAAEAGEADVKGFTERTFLLLCRDPKTGLLETGLVESVIEQFRGEAAQLDLAQKTVLERIQPGWKRSAEPRCSADPKDVVVPFDPSACLLFQDDLRTLVAASLEPADFFHHFDLLLRIHFGMYLPRIAVTLNPQVDCLMEEMEGGRGLERIEALLAESAKRHPFTGYAATRGPHLPQGRPVSTASRLAVSQLDRELIHLHFNLLVLMQLRRLAKAYLAHDRVGDDAGAPTLWPAGVEAGIDRDVQHVGDVIRRMRDDPGFRRYLDRGLTALCARFIDKQLNADSRDGAADDCRSARSSLHALHGLYSRHSLQSAPQPNKSRASRQGIRVTLGLLRHDDLGLMRSRAGIGAFFELGSSLLPLLLLLAIGQDREKAPVKRFWDRLEAYGLRLDSDERRHVEKQLRSMGVYERYSDSGDAVYVRNLLQPRVMP